LPVAGLPVAWVFVDAFGVSLRCLIVDDSPLFLEGAADLLDREGLEVVGVASNSAEAIRLVEELHPDVTLVDINLGDEDGFELTRRLRELWPGAKVILVSTHSEEDLAQLIASSPAIGFVSKARLSAEAIRATLEPVA
jgi:DNA-binding NarL/FixJ family response regulator